MTNWQINSSDLALIDLALQEDLGLPFTDITAISLQLDKNPKYQSVKVISKHHQNMVLCGLPVITAILSHFGKNHQVQSQFKEGDIVPPKETLITITAKSDVLVMAERTIINFLQHLSAIATLTKQFVYRINHTPLKILDTRKTTPGFRHLDKYAVQCGGGTNHRMGLYDALMIKDTHIDLLGGMKSALAKLPSNIINRYPVIVEVRNEQELKTAIDYGQGKITRILLDNMTCDQLKASVARLKGIFTTEASGGINFDNIADIAATGVDFASIGMLTHLTGYIDLAMVKS